MLTNLTHHHAHFIVIFVIFFKQYLDKILFSHSDEEADIFEVLFEK